MCFIREKGGINMDIAKETKLISNYIIGLRKYFHRYPELSMQEYNTSKKNKRRIR